MAKQVIFFHGGDAQEDFEADKKLVESLKGYLGESYMIQYPFLENDGSPDLGRRRQINQAISDSEDGVFLVGHSFGASMLLACLSEFELKRKITGIFLVAPPFWQGDEDWVQPFKLQPDFNDKLDREVPMFFYQCSDDEVVPLAHFNTYKKMVPWATFRELPVGGHQFDNDLSVVAKDILLL